MQINLFKEAIVWSMPYCSSCKKVIDILKEHNYEIVIKDLSNDFNRIELKKLLPFAKTVPLVIIGGKYIGGFQQVKEYLNRK